MSGETPGSGDWANPGQPTPEPAAAAVDAPAAWGVTPPTPPPPHGWTTPEQPSWGAPAPPPPPPGGWANAAPHGWAPAYVQQAPRPGIIPLRPLGIGELLDGAFTMIRRYPAATLGISAVVMLFVEAVQVVTTYYTFRNFTGDTSNLFGPSPDTDFIARSYTVQGIVLVATLIATVLLTGMMTAIAGQGVLGRSIGIGDAWARTRPLLLRLLGATLLVSLAWILGGLVTAIPGIVIVVIGAVGGSDGLAIFGIVVAALGWAVGAVYVYTKLALATPALVLEKMTVRGAITRSWRLVQSSFWRVFGIALLALVISFVVSGIIETPFSLAGGAGALFSGNVSEIFSFHALVITAIGGLIANTLVRPFQCGVTALLYIDRRMRAEALDLTLQQAAAKPSA